MGVRFPHPLQQDGPSRLSFFVIRAIIRVVGLPPSCLRAVSEHSGCRAASGPPGRLAFGPNFHCHPGCRAVIRAVGYNLSALSGKVNHIPTNSRHFPPINSCLPQSTCIHSPFLVCSFGESEPICHESVALSPGTKSDNRFYGYSAYILCPSYQGKVNQIPTNPWHFPGNIAPPPEILFLRYSSSALSEKVFHVILEQPVHDNFECIDNQAISKIDAHFGRLKLSKCALEFLMY